MFAAARCVSMIKTWIQPGLGSADTLQGGLLKSAAALSRCSAAVVLMLSTSAWASGQDQVGPSVVSEGQITFMAVRPDPEGYWYESRAWLSADSLESGLITLDTCHRQLDPNGRVVIRFNPERVRSIEVLSSQGIGETLVEPQRVDMRDVQRGGEICLRLQSRALEPIGDGRWRLHAGPLMRRYLDGYLPMRASLSVTWPEGLLDIAQVLPVPQAGVVFSQRNDGATLDMTFAGTLRSTWDLQLARR